MVVNRPIRISALVLALLCVPFNLDALPPAPPSLQSLPQDLPCTSPLAFKLSSKPPNPLVIQPRVRIGEKTENPIVTGDIFTVSLSLEQDCGKVLRIEILGADTETFQIAPYPSNNNGDVQKSLDAYFTQHPPSPPVSVLMLYGLLAAATIGALFAIATFIWTWQIQRSAKLAQKDRQESLPRGKTVRELIEDLSSKTSNLPTKVGKLEDQLYKVSETSVSILAKVETIMRALADLRKQAAPSTDAAQVQKESIPAYTSPSRTQPAVKSFAAAYNAALSSPGQENILPGVTNVIAVDPRPSEAGDKNPSSIEPLVPTPGGLLRVFVMTDLPSGQAYLAPSLELCARGIGGTHTRPWAALFDFPTEGDATSLDKAALVKRVNDQWWQIDVKGQMS